jgi:hypothetical protein
MHGSLFESASPVHSIRKHDIHTFVGYGKNPYAGVIMDAAGNLYGTVRLGRVNNGFIFEILKCHDPAEK